MRPRTQYLWSLLGAVLTAAAFVVYALVESPWFVLGWVGLVPWLATLDRLTSVRGALASGLLMSVVFVVGVFAWFAGAIASYTGLPLAGGFVVLAVLAPLVQPQFIVFAPVRQLARRRCGSAVSAVVGAGVYVGTEWLIGKLFGDTLGHGLYASVWLRQAADIAGAPGLTFVLVLFNECVLAAIRGGRPARRFLRPVIAGGVLLALPLGYGLARYREVTARAGTAAPVTVGLVQADISQYGRLAAERGTYDAVRYILDTHFALSADAFEEAPLDLLLWSETVYPTTFGHPKSPDGAAFDEEIGRFVAVTGVPLIFGAYDVEDGREFNAALVVSPAGDGRVAFEAYRKAWLFPLTERVPAWLDTPWLRAWLPWLGTWTPGVGSRVLEVTVPGGRPLRLVPLICYDAVDPRLTLDAVRDGAEMIVTLSNDSWFASGGGPRLHLVVSAFRSLETRRPQVRVTNTGISAIITPTGEWLETLGVHARGTIVQAVERGHGPATLMVRWGDWFGPTAGSLALAVLGLGCWVSGARRRVSGPNPHT